MISFLILCLTIIIKTNNINKTIPNNNFRKDRVKRNIQIDTYIFETNIVETYSPNTYNINVTYYHFYDRGLELYIFSTPELNEDITLLITLYIDMYNDSLGYWISKEIDVRAYDYYGTGNMFSAYIDELNLVNLTSDISLTILNIIVESNNTNNNYYVYFEEMTFNFPEGTDYDSSTSLEMSDSYYQIDTDSYYPDTTNNTESSYISVGNRSSGSISTGVIIGIIAGVVAVIGIIITIIIIYLRKRKKKKPPGGQTRIPGTTGTTGSTGSKPDETIENNSFKGLNRNGSKDNPLGAPKKKITIKTTEQEEIIIEIEEDKTIFDLKKLCLKKMGKSGNENILFLFNGENILIEPKVLIKDKFKSENGNNGYKIIMEDIDRELIKF